MIISTDAVVVCIGTPSAIVSVADICYCDKIIFLRVSKASDSPRKADF